MNSERSKQFFSRVLLSVVAVGLSLFLSPKAEAQSTFGQGDYVLEATDGTPFTQSRLVGQPSVVFFGFTHCPTICPTTLADMALWQDELGDRAGDLQYFFMTVDPERDTAEVLSDYVSWVPGVVGITGSTDEIEKAKNAFRIRASRVPLADGEYTMEHFAFVLIFGRDGVYRGTISYQEDIASVLEKLTFVLDE